RDPEARFGDETAFDAALGADEPDGVARMASFDQRPPDRDRRQHMAAGAAARDHRPDRTRLPGHDVAGRRVERPWRATFNSTPTAPIAITSDEPPYDTNGSGTPVTGSRPMTAPMLMTAWPTIHAV